MNPIITQILNQVPEFRQVTVFSKEEFINLLEDCALICLASDAHVADLTHECANEKEPTILTPAKYADIHHGFGDGDKVVGFQLTLRHFINDNAPTDNPPRHPAIAVSYIWSNGEIHEEPFAIVTPTDEADSENARFAWETDLLNKLRLHESTEREKRMQDITNAQSDKLREAVRQAQ